ncbi:MAG: hypothetical protein KDL87_06150 [Verrucomicrobiae bacterium]|nr:hypothetical protein [Verrucomicrobiae bacterium]
MSTLWHLLVWACVVWYGTVTIVVAVKGWRDIVTMLKRLKSGDDLSE